MATAWFLLFAIMIDGKFVEPPDYPAGPFASLTECIEVAKDFIETIPDDLSHVHACYEAPK
jgi:hypothetical protein